MSAKAHTYEAQCARDAADAGASREYCDYLEATAKRHRDFFLARGEHEHAVAFMTRSISEALQGNDGD